MALVPVITAPAINKTTWSKQSGRTTFDNLAGIQTSLDDKETPLDSALPISNNLREEG